MTVVDTSYILIPAQYTSDIVLALCIFASIFMCGLTLYVIALCTIFSGDDVIPFSATATMFVFSLVIMIFMGFFFIKNIPQPSIAKQVVVEFNDDISYTEYNDILSKYDVIDDSGKYVILQEKVSE